MKRTYAEFRRVPKASKVIIRREEEEENMNSDEELMPKALPVEGDLKELETREPQDANEYLLKVRMEANRYDHNSVATHLLDKEQLPVTHGYGPTSYLFQLFNPESQKRNQLFPDITSEWKQGVLESFKKVKKELEYARESKSKSINVLLFKDEELQGVTKPIEFEKRREFKDIFNEKDLTKRKKPLVSLLISFDNIKAEKLVEWLSDELVKIEEKQQMVNTFQCLWMFAILSLFETPLLPEICGIFNGVLTNILKLYEKLTSPETLSQNEEVEEKAQIKTSLTINAIIIMEYFGQKLYNL